MKRFFALIFVFVLILSTATISASATDLSKNVIDLGDGFYLKEVTVQRFYSRAGDTAVGHTSGNVYQLTGGIAQLLRGGIETNGT